MTSIIYFLERCLANEELKIRTKSYELLNGILRFFKLNMNEPYKYNSFFPTWLAEDNFEKNARIGWCYGDLSIGIVLLKYSKRNADPYFFNLAKEMIINTLDRKNPQAESINDAGLCHGSTGLALLYEEAYYLTGDESFINSSNYWLEYAMKQDIHKDGICGYKSYNGVDKSFINHSGFLEGVAGIGLSFIAKLDQDKGQWKKGLMMF